MSEERILTKSEWVLIIVIASILLFFAAINRVYARDNGWAETPLAQRQWFQNLMQPDNPYVNCCGEADAYEADDFEVVDGKVYAVVTDDRDDTFPNGAVRPHVAPGIRIEVPEKKIKWDHGNPTGHGWVFLSVSTGQIYCYVLPAGG